MNNRPDAPRGSDEIVWVGRCDGLYPLNVGTQQNVAFASCGVTSEAPGSAPVNRMAAEPPQHARVAMMRHEAAVQSTGK